MKKLLLPLLLLFGATNISAAPLIRVVAMVNNDAVTSYQLEKKLATAMAADTGKTKLSQQEHQALKRKVLDAMIEEVLVEQRIRDIGLAVSEQELDSAIEDVQKQNKLNREQLENALQAQGMSFSEYRQNLSKEILRYKLISREVRSKVEVTRAEIRAYFNDHEQEYLQPPTLQLGRISFPLTEKATEQERSRRMQEAQIARQQLLGGKPFTEVLESLGGEAEGGDMGLMVEAEMNAQLREAVTGLEVGQASEPREVLGSIHVFQVLARTAASSELTEEVSQKIERILAAQNSEKRFEEWKKELRKDASIDIRI